MWLLIQSDRCPNKKEIRTQTHRGTSTWGLGEDGHLHNQQRGLGRCAPGPRPSLWLPELTGNRRLPLPPPGVRLQLRRPLRLSEPSPAEEGVTADPTP